MSTQHTPEGLLAFLAAIGAFVGLGKVLASEEKLTPRLIIGRAITSGGLGACAGAITLVAPDADPLVTFAVAAALASLGTSGLEALVNRYLNRHG
ncbi:MAG: holin [Aquabacterium sp.]